MTKFFKPQVKLEHFTNINNINYNNNINNNNDINDFNTTLCATKTSDCLVTPAGADGLASLSSGEVICSGVGSSREILHSSWRGLKIDLFDNGTRGTGEKSLKLKFSIIKQDSTVQSLIALMNSPADYVWRQVDINSDPQHWIRVQLIQEDLEQNQIPFRISKCCLPGKKGSTDLVSFLIEQDKYWQVILIMAGQEFAFQLDKQGAVTAAQRAGNIIATKFVGQNNRPLITARELGLL